MIIAIDQGSSATKVIVVGGDGSILGASTQPVTSRAAEAVTSSVLKATRGAVKGLRISPRQTIIGISAQRSTIARFDGSGNPCGEVIPWWDRSGLQQEDVAARDAERFTRATGLPLIPNWFAGKLAKLLPLEPGLRAGTVDTLLMAWMTGGRIYRTDFSNACRTGLVDLHLRKRTDTLRKLFRIPEELKLAEIAASDAYFGAVTRPGFPVHGRIGAVMGDAGASLMGATGGRAGIMHMTLGTGGFLQYPVAASTHPRGGLYLAPAWKSGRIIRWTLEASIPAMASALNAGLKAVGLPSDAARRMTPRSTGRLHALLAPNGMGAIGPTHVTGLHFVGPWKRAPDEEKLGALLEGLAFLMARAILIFPERPRRITAGGGLSRLPFLLQSIADFTGIPVTPLAEPETSAWGTAMLASNKTAHQLNHIPWLKPISPRRIIRGQYTIFREILHGK
ncbi:MAG: FGGY family carbohydrate kinase [Candidatus Hydrogenedentota bacterium]